MYGKIQRHEESKQKYKFYENSKLNKIKLNELKGDNEKDRLPYPGEFFIVQSVQKQRDSPPKQQFRPTSGKLTLNSDNRMFIDQDIEYIKQQPIVEQKSAMTKNIRTIIKKQNLRMFSPSSQLLKGVIDNCTDQKTKHVPTLHYKKKLSRPLSSVMITQAMKTQQVQNPAHVKILKEALQYDKKMMQQDRMNRQLSYVVKNKTSINSIKYTGGYQTIRLTRNDIDKKVIKTDSKISPFLISHMDCVKKQLKKGKYIQQKPINFLPLDYYLMDDDQIDPSNLIDLYRDKYFGMTNGVSKWFDTKGNYQWRRCEVISYIPNQQRFKIKWFHNDINKIVSRVNLCFEGQNIEQFKKKIAKAQQFRQISQYFIKYNYMIDIMESPTDTLQNNQYNQQNKMRINKNRIITMAQGHTTIIISVRNLLQFIEIPLHIKYNSRRYIHERVYNSIGSKKYQFPKQSMIKLQNEIKQLYIRTNHQIQFNFLLPYSQQKQTIFKGILPQKYFIPIISQPSKSTNKKGCIDVGYNNQNKFLIYLKNIISNAFVANSDCTIIMRSFIYNILQIQKYTFVCDAHYPTQLQSYINKWSSKIESVVRIMANKMNQVEQQITKAIKQFKLKIEKAMQFGKVIDYDFKKVFKNYMFLVNHRFQLSLREHFQKNTHLIINQFNKTIIEYKSINDISIHQPIDSVKLEHITKYIKQFQFYSTNKKQILIFMNIGKHENQNKIRSVPDITYTFNNILQTFELIKYEQSKMQAMGHLQFTTRQEKEMKITDQDNPVYQRMTQQLKSVLFQHQKIIQTYLQYIINRFQFLIQGAEIKKNLRKANFEQFQNQLRSYKNLLIEAEDKLPSRPFKLGFFYVDCIDLKTLLKKKINETTDEIYKMLIQKIQRENDKLSKIIQQIKVKLQTQPNNLQQMHDIRLYAKETLFVQLNNIYIKVNQIMMKMDLLSQMNYRINYKDFEKSWQIYSEPLKVRKEQQKCLKRMLICERKFGEDLSGDQISIVQQINIISRKLDKYILEHDLDQLNQYSIKFSRLGERITNALIQSQIINRRQEILKWKITDFKDLQKLKDQFLPYQKVWGLAKRFELSIPSIMNGPLTMINKYTLMQEIQQSWTDLYNLQKGFFKTIPHMLSLTRKVRKLYEGFKPYLPLINDLRNPDMRNRHWKRIAEITGIVQFQDGSQITLNNCIARGIQSKKEQIKDVSQIASKELDFEKILNRMKRQWKEVKFKLIDYTQCDTSIIKEVDKVFDKLDEDTVKIQAILSSPYIKFLQNQVINFRNQYLFRAIQTIQLWMKVQKDWIYLQPIFSSEDINQQLPKQSLKFQSIEKMWKSIMAQTKLQPNVMQCSQGKFKDAFISMIQNLQQLHKSLSQYLNTKRVIFPRFYFLSNEQLLQIMSRARIVTTVQKHLPKCFQGINTLQFNKDMQVTHLYSLDGEKIQLSNKVITSQGDKVKSVQLWLKQLDQNACSSLCKQIMNKWPNAPINCGQLEHLYQQLKWTYDCQNCLKGHQTLISLYKKTQERLIELINKIRIQNNKLNFKTLTVMVVLVVHNKDVIMQLKNNYSKINSFEWMSQMRYYIEQTKNKLNIVNVKMINTIQKYGFEYLGNQQRLVITQLTDRCYRTLMSALQMCMGGAPQGPAGTGKTQTTKDLAKAIGKHCVVFNCSQALDYVAMGMFFKGLTSCGSWACFDQFNRIQLDVLSVIAQQILTIQTALLRDSMSKNPSRSFVFEGIIVPLDSSCAIFITMNPGYAGRTQLPDNLKALFRPVAMMIPNYEMITQIIFYSYGFKSSRQLSIKIIASLKLASQQLSTQNHYDFGMRAVKSIIYAAGMLKRELPDLDEYEITVKAISFCNISKLTSKDIPLFEAILSDLFPQVMNNIPQDQNLLMKINQSADQMNIVIKPKFILKIMQVLQMQKIRHGVMLVGSTISGKTTIIKLLSKSINAQLQVLNPKSISNSLLFGQVQPLSNEWHDGIAAKIVRDIVQKRVGYKQDYYNKDWIMFDGPVDSLWIQSMNTLLDDNKKLCLPNGQTIKINPQTNILFETDNLKEASPATISRCGMIFMQSQDLAWTSLLQPWQHQLVQPLRTKGRIRIYDQIFKHLIQPLVHYLSSDYRTNSLMINQPIKWLILIFLRLFESMLLGNKTKEIIEMEIATKEEKQRRRKQDAELQGKQYISKNNIQQQIDDTQRGDIFALALMAVIWSFGTAHFEESRKGFSKEFKHIYKRCIQISIKGIHKSFIPPDDCNVFDVKYQNKTWVQWNNGVKVQIGDKATFNQIFIPTIQSIRHRHIINCLIQHKNCCLLVGRTGAGKTLIAKQLILNLDQSKFIITSSCLNATTSCSNLLEVLQSKLQKQKRRKGVYGPIIGSQNIIFLDDMNMPVKQKYGAQPPLQLIRQWMSSRGWYDPHSLQFKRIEDILFMGAMGLSRPPISQRLIRHFNLIFFNDLQDQTLRFIVQSILNWGYKEFNLQVKQFIKNMSRIIINLHRLVTKQFLPLPRKSHYLFNMRDIMRIVEGIIKVKPYYYKDIIQPNKSLIQLWVHESICQYSDRLCEQNDRIKFFYSMNNVLLQQFHLRLKQILEGDQKDDYDTSRLINYGSFGNQNKYYEPFKNKQETKKVINNFISQYNEINTNHKIQIVLFEDAVSLLVKISRVLSKPFGNILIVGLGGYGVKSMTRLANFIEGFKLFQPTTQKNENYDWQQFCKRLLQETGQKKIKSTLILGGQLRDKILQDVNNLLNIGQIPGIYTLQEKQMIIQQIKQFQKIRLNYMQVWQMYITRNRLNLHIVTSFSPIGNQLTYKIRNFPSIVSCNTTIWLFSWSQSALLEVQKWFFDRQQAKQELPTQIDKKLGRPLVCFHQDITKITQKFFNDTGLHFYVTPFSFIKMLQNFMKMFKTEGTKLEKNRIKYVEGVKKLNLCGQVVQQLKKQLEDLKPILASKSAQTQQILKNVEIQNHQTKKQTQVVRDQQQIIKKKTDKAQSIRQECQQRLKQALPMLKQATDALKTLQMKDFVQMKTNKHPTMPIKLTMQGMLIMLCKQPQKNKPVWPAVVKELTDPSKFIKRVENYKIQQVTEKVIEKITIFLQKNQKFLNLQSVQIASKACLGLYKWLVAMHKYYFVNKTIEPLKADLAEAQKQVEQANKQLAKKRKLLQQMIEKGRLLAETLQKQTQQKNKLKAQINDCQNKIQRALKLTKGLAGQKDRWVIQVGRLSTQINQVSGNIILSACFMSYLTAFTYNYRKLILQQKWIPMLIEQQIQHSSDFSIVKFLGNPIEIQEWMLAGLPLDQMSQENAVSMKIAQNYPLIIDPQQQALKWLKRWFTRHDDKHFKCVKKDIVTQLQLCITNGYVLVIYSIGECISPLLDNVLRRQFKKTSMGLVVQIGLNSVLVDPQFKLYLISSLPNPHYSPQTLGKVTLVNFSLTVQALNDQMLSITAREEDPSLQQQKTRIMVDNAQNATRLAQIEEIILTQLQSVNGPDMLQDQKLVHTLSQSKLTSVQIQSRMNEAQVTKRRINNTRQNYQQVALYSSSLFFKMLSLQKINHMYQYSLDYYVKVYRKAIKNADKPPNKNIKLRAQMILDSFKKTSYSEISKSLFVKDKMLFSFLLLINTLQSTKLFNAACYKFLTKDIIDGSGNIDVQNNPLPQYIEQKVWNKLGRLQNIACFKGIRLKIIENQSKWMQFLKSIKIAQPMMIIDEPLAFLCLVKVFSPQYELKALQTVIKKVLGEYFLQQWSPDLNQFYLDSSIINPIMFLLSPGDDPQQQLKKIGIQKGKMLQVLSLGRGQNQYVEKKIWDNMGNGGWVLLQNCHLGLKFLHRLVDILDQIGLDLSKKDKNKTINTQFRIWITTMCVTQFNNDLIQASFKVTQDPPRGMKANIKSVLNAHTSTKIERKFYNDSCKSQNFHRLFLGLCYFHAVVRERKRYGALGWNCSYDFNFSDFKISVRQLKLIIESNQQIPFNSLNYLTAQCYYGGKVTDSWDRRLINSILQMFYNSKVGQNQDYYFSTVLQYHIPTADLIYDVQSLKKFIDQIPQTSSAELVGMNEAAALAAFSFQSNTFMKSIKIISGNNKESTHQFSNIVNQRINTLLSDTLNEFDVQKVSLKYKSTYMDCMNTVLLQQILRYNTLISMIRQSLKNICLALDGQIAMNQQLEELANCIYCNIVPSYWIQKSYSTKKPLLSYHIDLVSRLQFFKDWINKGQPNSFWVPGFFFPQSFFTGLKQLYSRTNKIEIEKINFKFNVLTSSQQQQIGTRIHGLYLEGASWNQQYLMIDEVVQDKLITPFLDIDVIAHANIELIEQKQYECSLYKYECPLYKTSDRRGILTSIGHSSNFIIAIYLPCMEYQNLWIKRGAALLCQLDD